MYKMLAVCELSLDSKRISLSGAHYRISTQVVLILVVAIILYVLCIACAPSQMDAI